MPRQQGPKRTRREIEVILRRFRASGLSQRAFGQAHSISPNTIAFWLRRERREGNSEPSRALVAIEPPATVEPDPFEFEVAGGRIFVPRNVTVEQWRTLREAWSI
jgi:hypothetical protein